MWLNQDNKIWPIFCTWRKHFLPRNSLAPAFDQCLLTPCGGGTCRHSDCSGFFLHLCLTCAVCSAWKAPATVYVSVPSLHPFLSFTLLAGGSELLWHYILWEAVWCSRWWGTPPLSISREVLGPGVVREVGRGGRGKCAIPGSQPLGNWEGFPRRQHLDYRLSST